LQGKKKKKKEGKIENPLGQSVQSPSRQSVGVSQEFSNDEESIGTHESQERYHTEKFFNRDQAKIKRESQEREHTEKVFNRNQEKSKRRLLRQPSIRGGFNPRLIREPSVLLAQCGRWGKSVWQVLPQPEEGSPTLSEEETQRSEPETQRSEPETQRSEPETQRSEPDISLSEITSFVKEISDSGNSDITTDVLVQFIKDYPENVDILAFAIGKIWDFCKGSDSEDYKKSVIHTSAPDDILQAMKTHFKNPIIQEQSCGALWSLCSTTPAYRKIVIRAGASPRIINAFIEHIHNVDVVSAGLGCLRTISPDTEARESIRVLSGVEHVCEAMKVHSDVTWIQRDGCAFLSNCAVDVERQQVALALDVEIEAITNALFTHQNDPNIIAGGCFVIKNLTHEESNIRRLRQVDGIMELLEKTSLYCELPCAKEDAEAILETFGALESDDYHLENQVIKSISEIEKDYRTTADNKTIQVIALIEDYSWSCKVFAAILNCLTNLSQMYPDQKESISSDLIIQHVVTHMKKYEDFTPIQINGCKLLEEMVKDNDSCWSTIFDMDGCEAVVKAITKHDAQKVGRVVLRALSKAFLSEKDFEFFIREKIDPCFQLNQKMTAS